MRHKAKVLMAIAVLAAALFSTALVGGQVGRGIVVAPPETGEGRDTAGGFPPQQFDELTRELALMEDLFGGGGTELVTFDAEAARRRGFSQQAIQLAGEMAFFTNDLIVGARAGARAAAERSSAPVDNESVASRMVEVDVTTVEANTDVYPLLSGYLKSADAQADNAGTVRAPRLGGPDAAGSAAQQNERTAGLAIPFVSKRVCGSIGNPKPSRAAPRLTLRGLQSPSLFLRMQGYHETPGRAGGGWTRPQTYKPVLCGWHTYRDHAIITGRHSVSTQTYRGWEPDGEPNPEVWRSGPWPYRTWPAYVYWWHRKF